MSAFELIANPKLPHQIKIVYSTGTQLKATCNCSKWSMLFHPETEGARDQVIAEYKQHLPGGFDATKAN